jgi:ABC-type amino acid transport system permease subunit
MFTDSREKHMRKLAILLGILMTLGGAALVALLAFWWGLIGGLMEIFDSFGAHSKVSLADGIGRLAVFVVAGAGGLAMIVGGVFLIGSPFLWDLVKRILGVGRQVPSTSELTHLREPDSVFGDFPLRENDFPRFPGYGGPRYPEDHDTTS